MAARPDPAGAFFRPMLPQDLDDVAAVDARAYEWPWSRGIFADCLRAGYTALVLERAGVLLGHGLMSIGAGEAHILNVCVDPPEQGQGAGRRITRRLLDIARIARCERVWLEVRPSNLHAVALYESLGFNEIGRRPGYYPAPRGREEALVMGLELLGP